jgi:S-(hydroxymethyl)glutathione dehydrogenase/alcohol dehydrogenase
MDVRAALARAVGKPLTIETNRLEGRHKGWGQCLLIGVAGAGQETDVPKLLDWYMDGKIEIEPMTTLRRKRDATNEAFDLMHAGESIRTVVSFD